MKVQRIHIAVTVLLLSLLLLMVVQGYVLHLNIKVEEERFEEVIDATLLDLHHNVEDDEELSGLLIDILEAKENNRIPPQDKVNTVIMELHDRIDSISQKNGIFLDSDFILYDTEHGDIQLASLESIPENLDFREHTVKAGWRIRETLGEGKYRFGLHFYNQYVYLLKELGFLLILSAGVFLVLTGGVVYTLLNWKRQKELTALKDDFINNLTHELKTPIFSSSLLHKVIRRKIKGNENGLDKYLGLLEEENIKLKERVEKVLEIAELEHPRLSLDYKSIDLHDLIHRSIKSLKFLTEQQGGEISLELNAEHSTVSVDPVHFANVIYNIVDNSTKYNESSPHIRIITSNRDKFIIVQFQDNGIGIRKKDQEFIFDKFYRVNTGNLHKVKGFGLGLSYVKMIVEQHDGHLHLQSTPGKGTIFEIKIPLDL